MFGTNDVPDVGKYDVHGYGAKLVFKVADVKDDHLIVDVDIGLLREDACECASGIFAKALSELRASAFHVK